MKINRILTLLILLNWTAFKAQTGYLGNKNLIGLNVYANAPLIGQEREKVQFQKKGDQMTSKKEWINVGLDIQYARAMSKRYSIGFELNNKMVQIHSPEYFIVSNVSQQETFIDTIHYRSAPLAFNHISSLVRFEFYNKQGAGNIGIVHALGLGPSIVRIIQKPYAFSLNEFGNTDSEDEYWTKPEYYYFEEDWNSIFGLSANYSLFMRYPISNHVSLNFGLKTLFNVYFKPNELIRENKNNAPYDLSNAFYNLQRETFINLHLNGGINFHL